MFDPSGTVVYFVSKTAQNGSNNGTATAPYNVWKVNTDGTGRTPLTNNTTSGYDAQDVAVSPDGSTLVYASLAWTGGATVRSYNIWTIGTNGTNNGYLTNQTSLGRDSRYPQFSPDGTEIVFASKMRISGVTPGSYNIWTMTSAGASQVALTTNTASGLDSINPNYSPDSTKIAFASMMNIGVTNANSYNIWVMNSDGNNMNYLTANTNSGLDSLLGPGQVWYAP